MISVPTPVVGPELLSVSPSAIKDFMSCPRRWWLQKRCGLKTPEQDHLVVGTGFHSAMERYFDGPTRGTLYNPEDFAQRYFPRHEKRRTMLTTVLHSGLLMLREPDAPKPADGILSEVPRDYATGLTLASVALRQRSDLLDPRNKSLLLSYDFKTSSKVHSDFTKSPEELVHDPQAILYLWEAFEKFKPDAARFHHLTCGTSQVEQLIIPTDTLSYERVMEGVARLTEIVEEMKVVFAINEFHKVPPGKGAPSPSFGSPCRSFGGCFFAATHCGVELPEKKSTSVTPPPPKPEQTMSTTPKLRDRIAAMKAAGKLAEGINPPDAARPAPVTPYSPPTLSATPVPAPSTTTAATPPRSANELIKRIEADLAELRALVGGQQ